LFYLRNGNFTRGWEIADSFTRFQNDIKAM
jgi:hypothetical protein